MHRFVAYKKSKREEEEGQEYVACLIWMESEGKGGCQIV